MKKILIHIIAFSPDGVSTAYIYNDISTYLKERGFEVVVLTTTPHFNAIPEELAKQPLKRVFGGLFYKSTYNGIEVIHVPQKKFKNAIFRLFGFVYWHILSFIIGLFQRNIDVILSPSPPLTLGLVNIVLGKLKRAKVIYNVQEIYPDLLIENGGLKSPVIISFLKRLERFIYNKSDFVTTIDQIFYNTIKGRFKQADKLQIIPNFVDTTIYKPTESEEAAKLLQPTDALKLMYAGNIGLAQDWNILIELAKKLKNENIEFYVMGEGAMKDKLQDDIVSNELHNIYLLPYQARHLMPAIISSVDMHFIFMAPETEGHGFPSKVYTIMACAKPLLISSGLETPITKFLLDKSCAFLSYEQQFEQRVDALYNILKQVDKETLKVLGENGYKHVNQYYTKEIVTEQYYNLINKVLK